MIGETKSGDFVKLVHYFVNYFTAASYALSSVTLHVVAPCNDAALLAPSIWSSVLVVECAVNNFCFLDTILFHVCCI